MKRIILFLILFPVIIFCQEFTVEKVSGDVRVMKGTNEIWIPVKIGDKLSGDDLITTGSKAVIQISRSGKKFILGSNSALEVNLIKKISINELLLALAMEEIRNVPKIKSNGNFKNTAVYGKEIRPNETEINISNDLGVKRLNGAMQLAESGYKETAILFARETYRKYPSTKNLISNRLFFVDILIDLGLYSEADSELAQIKQLNLTSVEKDEVNKRIDKIKFEEISR
ncbi:hypothetical protein ABRY23_05265 [Melioribacteraceae bacterium 4301-Me]|uniref:hypothetical protein n=1 Tax=Pyranulibacter aquaticus TaxID=3163344 RepID=UPI00359A76BD